jgi:hypothetical protein
LRNDPEQSGTSDDNFAERRDLRRPPQSGRRKTHRSLDAATGAPVASASVRPSEFSGE